MFGLGLVIFTKVDTDQHLMHILFGNVLGVTTQDLIETAIVAGGTLLVVLVKRRDLLLYCFDPNHARSIGLPVRVMHYGLLVLLSLTIVASLKAVGIILVIAMLIAPGATAYLLTDSFERMLVIATATATVSAALGTIRQLPHRRGDRRLHRADPGLVLHPGIPVCAEARHSSSASCFGCAGCGHRHLGHFPIESERTPDFYLTRFPDANRSPPRIKSGAGFRWKTL